MPSLITLKGPNPGQSFPLPGPNSSIGRQPDVDVYLESLAVSRQHARIVCQNGDFFIEDLDSSNGTYVNGEKIGQRCQLTEDDTVQIGPYLLALRPDRPGSGTETNTLVRASINAHVGNQTLYASNASQKLHAVLEIAQHLGHTLELDPLLNQLLERLLRLFPQADRGVVLLCRGTSPERQRRDDPVAGAPGLCWEEQLMVQAQCHRHHADEGDALYSKTVVRRALDEGIALLSEDVADDPHFQPSSTMVSLNLRSFLCVPLLGREQRRLGVIQMDCTRFGQAFRRDDLELLAAVGIQVAAVLENAAFHAEQLRQVRLQQDLLMAREIQQAFLPADFNDLAARGLDVFARVQPAREVSGDLYDFFLLPDGRLAFFLGDVSGKGMPAALFMVAVRTLIRHLASSASGPADLLLRLNRALVDDNPTALYVTLVHGIYDPRDGGLVLTLGGHPQPLLRRGTGRVEPLTMQTGCLLGSPLLAPVMNDTELVLAPGETLILYTDGFTETHAPDGKTMFGIERLCEVLGGPRTDLPLADCADEASAALRRFAGEPELQDDQTLFFLRRN